MIRILIYDGDYHNLRLILNEKRPLNELEKYVPPKMAEVVKGIFQMSNASLIEIWENTDLYHFKRLKN